MYINKIYLLNHLVDIGTNLTMEIGTVNDVIW